MIYPSAEESNDDLSGCTIAKLMSQETVIAGEGNVLNQYATFVEQTRKNFPWFGTGQPKYAKKENFVPGEKLPNPKPGYLILVTETRKGQEEALQMLPSSMSSDLAGMTVAAVTLKQLVAVFVNKAPALFLMFHGASKEWTQEEINHLIKTVPVNRWYKDHGKVTSYEITEEGLEAFKTQYSKGHILKTVLCIPNATEDHIKASLEDCAKKMVTLTRAVTVKLTKDVSIPTSEEGSEILELNGMKSTMPRTETSNQQLALESMTTGHGVTTTQGASSEVTAVQQGGPPATQVTPQRSATAVFGTFSNQQNGQELPTPGGSVGPQGDQSTDGLALQFRDYLNRIPDPKTKKAVLHAYFGIEADESGPRPPAQQQEMVIATDASSEHKWVKQMDTASFGSMEAADPNFSLRLVLAGNPGSDLEALRDPTDPTMKTRLDKLHVDQTEIIEKAVRQLRKDNIMAADHAANVFKGPGPKDLTKDSMGSHVMEYLRICIAFIKNIHLMLRTGAELTPSSVRAYGKATETQLNQSRSAPGQARFEKNVTERMEKMGFQTDSESRNGSRSMTRSKTPERPKTPPRPRSKTPPRTRGRRFGADRDDRDDTRHEVLLTREEQNEARDSYCQYCYKYHGFSPFHCPGMMADGKDVSYRRGIEKDSLMSERRDIEKKKKKKNENKR